MALATGRLDIALVHYPVYNKNRQVITSAVTNLDIHDLARAARTYGVGSVYIVTPVTDQQQLVAEITGHWQDGHGARYNPDRKEALATITICPTIAEAIARADRHGRTTVLATAAQPDGPVVEQQTVRQEIAQGKNVLLLFGTAWGLSQEVFAQVDGILAPIRAGHGYNHLSVRSAVAIMLDRLVGERPNAAPIE